MRRSHRDAKKRFGRETGTEAAARDARGVKKPKIAKCVEERGETCQIADRAREQIEDREIKISEL
jgi:hypothetical protein